MSLKYSRQRESIRENLINRMDHPTADMVYSDIRQIYPNISLGTVYRNLALLSDRGEIARIHTKDGTLHFDRNTEPHDHFVCRSCGRITDIEAPSAEEIKEEATPVETEATTVEETTTTEKVAPVAEEEATKEVAEVKAEENKAEETAPVAEEKPATEEPSEE